MSQAFFCRTIEEYLSNGCLGQLMFPLVQQQDTCNWWIEEMLLLFFLSYSNMSIQAQWCIQMNGQHTLKYLLQAIATHQSTIAFILLIQLHVLVLRATGQEQNRLIPLWQKSVFLQINLSQSRVGLFTDTFNVLVKCQSTVDFMYFVQYNVDLCQLSTLYNSCTFLIFIIQ